MIPFKTVRSLCDYLLREYGSDTKVEYVATAVDSWIVCPAFHWAAGEDNTLVLTTTILNRPNQEWDMHSAEYRNLF